jgi:hypothetical protein
MKMVLHLGLVLALAVAGFAAFSFYEARYLGLFPLGEVPPKADAYHFARSAFALFFSFLIVLAIHRNRSPDSSLDRSGMAPLGAAAALAVLALAVACTVLFAADPVAFGAGAVEDSPIEWLSALLLLGASFLFANMLIGRLRAGSRLLSWACLPPLVFALLLFVMGMEEISWMQRVIGFDTPPELARANMQQEFNLHNVHTDLSENVYYVGVGTFLILLPFLRDALHGARGALGWIDAYVPGRWVAAVAAPLSIFNYGMWNVIPMQMTMMLTVLVCLFYARAAHGRGDRREAALFAAIGVAVVAGQAAFLAWGHLLPYMWDASEYKELFLTTGLAAWGVDSALGAPGRSRAPAPDRVAAAA